MIRASILITAASLAFGMSACASSSYGLSETVDSDVVQYFPQEGRRWSYEAENEVIIAMELLDSARDAVAEIDVRIADMDDTFTAVEDRGGKGRDVADAKLSSLEAKRDEFYAEVAYADLNVLCARARLELTKAQLAVRFDLPVEEDFIEPFEEQHNDCEEDLAEARAEADELFQEALKAKENWRNVRATYAQRTGDHNHGLWID